MEDTITWVCDSPIHTAETCSNILRDAASYLPSAMNSPDESAPHIKCSFGPFGSQQQLNIKMLDTLRMGTAIFTSRSAWN